MSDSLRTRIAKALYGQILHPVPLFDSQPDEVKDAWLADADAVIRELGLEVEDGECGYCQAQLPGCRYVTEWENNDE
jgi:hypothetical protein